MGADSDDDFMQESGDEEEFDFEYEDDDDQEEAPDAIIENKYYNAKQNKSSDPQAAITDFLSIPPLEQEKGEWGFKGLKQAIKLELSLKRYDAALKHYQELLTYIKSAVNRNYGEKSITNMLGHLEKVSDDKAARHCMENFYSKTLDSFSSTRNDRLWLKINLRFARLYLEAKDYQSLLLKLRELYEACKTEPGEDPDSSKGTYLLESYALEIQMYAEQNNIKRLKVLYEKAIKVRSAVPHPKIMGIIRECGGKMHMREENWDQAQQAFFESFRNYDEAGSVQRIQVLKYLVLTTMLMKSEINPFDSQETKPYRDDPRIAGMNALVDAYQRGEVTQYENILRQYRDEIFGDEFISEYIQEVTRNVRMKALAKLVAPYDSFTVEFVAKQLKVPEVEALDLLSFLILDGGLPAKIDQAKGQVHLVGNPDQARVDALSRWSAAVGSLCAVVTKESDGIMSKKGPMPPLAGSRLIEQYAFDMLSLSSSKKGGDEGEVGGDDDQGGDRGDGQIHRLDSPFKGLNGRKRLRDAQSRLHPVSQGDESLGYGTKDLRGMETLFGSP